MIVTRVVGLRLAAIILATVVVQVSFFSYLQLFGTTPDITPVIVGGIGLLGGGVVGAVTGFATGLLLDASLLQTLGVSSLVLLSVGYLAGRYRESTAVVGRYAPAAVIGILTLGGAAVFAAVQLTLGVDTQVSVLFVREIIVKGLLAFLLALLLLPLLRLSLRSALVEDERGATVERRAGSVRRKRPSAPSGETSRRRWLPRRRRRVELRGGPA